MTLQEFINWIGENPNSIIFYFLGIPVIAILLNFICRGEGHTDPWRYLYSIIIYMVSVPGILGFALSVYLFLFERRSIYDTDIFTQILPFVSMVATLLIIRRNVSFENIPGIDRISGLVFMIFGAFAFMWFLDRTHIYAITFVPFYQLVLIFIGLMLLMRWGWSRFVSK